MTVIQSPKVSKIPNGYVPIDIKRYQYQRYQCRMTVIQSPRVSKILNDYVPKLSKIPMSKTPIPNDSNTKS